MKPDVRLIAVDMDGTLLNEHSQVSDITRDAIQEAKKRGILFSACTGRFPDDASLVMKESGIEGAVISVNGCVIYDKPFGNRLTEHLMAPETARCVVDVLETLGEGYFIFGRNAVYSRRKSTKHHSETDFIDDSLIKKRVKYYYGRDACLDAVNHPLYKFYIYHTEGGLSLEKIKSALDCVPEHSLTQSGMHNIEVMPAHVDKGTGLHDLAMRMGIQRENILAIGDQMNDLPMLSYAGISVAMGNAVQAVKDAAVYVTETNINHGVAQAIHRFCL